MQNDCKNVISAWTRMGKQRIRAAQPIQFELDARHTTFLVPVRVARETIPVHVNAPNSEAVSLDTAGLGLTL